MKYPGSYVRESCRNGGSVWVRGTGLARREEASLGTWEGGRPLSNRRGYRTRNLLRGGLLADFHFVLAARAGARGSLGLGGRGVVVRV